MSNERDYFSLTPECISLHSTHKRPASISGRVPTSKKYFRPRIGQYFKHYPKFERDVDSIEIFSNGRKINSVTDPEKQTLKKLKSKYRKIRDVHKAVSISADFDNDPKSFLPRIMIRQQNPSSVYHKIRKNTMHDTNAISKKLMEDFFLYTKGSKYSS